MQTAIIVPATNRDYYLRCLLSSLPEYLASKNNINNFNIIVTTQLDDTMFNRSLSLNVGIKYAVNILNADHIVTHDVDIVPICNVDYNYQNTFLTWFMTAGGLNALSNDFIKINGYCNEFVGWGEEDVEIIHRARFYQIPVTDYKTIALNKNPTILNMEFHESWDSEEMSKRYWGQEWPRFINCKEHGIEYKQVDKNYNWNQKEYTEANWDRCKRSAALDSLSRDRYYQSTGLNQVNLNNLHHVDSNPEQKLHRLYFETNRII